MDFQELHKKLSPTIKRIAYRLNGHYRSFSHDDLYQQACLHLWTDYCRGKLDDKTDSYILQGCYFHLKNYIRKVNERPNLVSIEAGACGDENPAVENILDKHCCSCDCRDALHDKLLCQSISNNGLEPKEKTVLEYYSQGLTTRDIGKKLGVSHVYVVKMTRKIRGKCLKHLDQAD